jgi:hypothetical protein
MEIHKPRKKAKGISEQGNNNARMGRGVHVTAGREKGRRRGRNTNEGETDGARRNRNHSGRESEEGDFRRKMMMLESMVESVLMYGPEIWGSKEQREVENMQE